MRAKAKFDCVSNHPSELSFKQGELFLNVQTTDEPGWLLGRLLSTNQFGLIPKNYIEIEEDQMRFEREDSINSVRSVGSYKGTTTDIRCELKKKSAEMINNKAQEKPITRAEEPPVPLPPRPPAYTKSTNIAAPKPAQKCPAPPPLPVKNFNHQQLFKSLDTKGTGKVSGNVVRPIWMKSDLNVKVLGDIWAMVDRDADGWITEEEFVYGMTCIESKKK